MSNHNFTYGVEAFVETIGETSRICYSDEFFKEYEQKHNHEIAKLRSDLFDGKTGAKLLLFQDMTKFLTQPQNAYKSAIYNRKRRFPNCIPNRKRENQI